MTKTVNIIPGDFLTLQFEDNPANIELTKWVCDKIHDKLHIRGAFGQWTVDQKDQLQLNGTDETDLSVIRAAVGANW